MRPLFSVVIPTHARPPQLANCLAALARLDYPCDRFEVIVVDDGGMTPPETLEPFRSSLNLRLVVQAHAGPARARNAGAAVAAGEYLVFTDDDCTPEAGWLRAFEDGFKAASGHAIGGKVLNALPHNLYSTASQSLVDFLYSYYNSVPGDACFFTSNNLAMPADRFREIGGFDTSFNRAGGEDRELCDRWRYLGHPMTYCADATVLHAHSLSLRRFVRQHFAYGTGAYHFHLVRAHRRQKAIRLEPPRFYIGLIRHPLEQTRNGRAGLLAGLFVLSQAANVAGFFYEVIRRERPHISSRAFV